MTVRVLFAFLGFSALVTEVATLVAQHRFGAGDFFSYFTVEANLLTVISLMLSAFAAAGRWSSRGLELYRGAVAFFMTTVILIFIVLLSGYPASELTAVPWDNTVLHYIMPIVVILDWLLLTGRRAMSVRAALGWLLGPLAYLVYSLVRGGIVGWYPYPFMDPGRHGYLGVAVTSVIIAVVLSLLALALAVAPRWTALRGARPTGQ
ncbi:Pr6Pr family membrane protein [Allobranchiibius sp. GilTou73]|uniref:Pr6Pr family membrane protein n=1 Tax=Allobranchiibius sp. GilTou73 TaxID=2904523 RepID=UPI001F2E72A5|nr:Pr6Pr family membrane protein [Allobranchiibius sp. GilTou73]UIJ36231.1 Pr6Pr family membrane protein [Allobranchiibius sp. GilTou73]